MITCSSLEGVSQNLQLINGHFKTTSGHFFANYNLSQNWFSDSHFEVLNRFKSYLDKKLWQKWKTCKKIIQKIEKKKTETEIFAICVITFEPIKIWTCFEKCKKRPDVVIHLDPHNKMRLNLLPYISTYLFKKWRYTFTSISFGWV